MTKISSFILIVILLHVITFVASAEEDGGVSLVKRARTKEKHKKQLVDHWFPNHTGDNPQQDADDGSGDDSHLQTSPTAAQAGTSRRPQRLQRKTVTKGSSAKTKSSTEYLLHSSSPDWDSEGPPSAYPSSEKYEGWKPGDASSTDSSSAHSEDWNSQETSSSSQSSDWDPKQARRHAFSTARTRSLLSKAKAKPKALNLKAGSLLKAAANDARRHRASESSAHVHTSSDEKSIIAVRPSSSSQEPLPLARPKMTYSMPRLKNPETRAESEKAHEEYEQSVADGTPKEEARATYTQSLFSICKKVRETLPYKSHIPCFKLLTSERETMGDDEYHAVFIKEAKRYHQTVYRKDKEAERKKYLRDRFGPTEEEVMQGMVFTPEQARNLKETRVTKRLGQRLATLLKQKDHPERVVRRPAPWSEEEDREVTDIIAKDPGRFHALERDYRLFQRKLSCQNITATHGPGQQVERNHHEESEEHSHYAVDHTGQTKSKNGEDFPLSSLGQHDEEKDILTTPSLYQSSQSDETLGANSDIPKRSEQANSSDMSDDAAPDGDQGQAPLLTSDLLKLLREKDPTIPRRLRSRRKGPQKEFEDEGAASSEESIDTITESPNVRPAARHSAEVRGKNKSFQAELAAITRNVVNDFKKTSHQNLSYQDQKIQLTKAIFQALSKFRQRRLKEDPFQAKRPFFALKGLNKKLIDEKMFQSLKEQHLKEEWQGKQPGYQIDYYSRRFGPSNAKLAKGYTGTLEQKRERDDGKAIRLMKDRLQRWIPDGTGKKRTRKPWTKIDTNKVIRLIRDYPSRKTLLKTFEEARPYLPRESWQETTSRESLLGAGGEEARIEGNSKKDEMVATPRRRKKTRST